MAPWAYDPMAPRLRLTLMQQEMRARGRMPRYDPVDSVIDTITPEQLRYVELAATQHKKVPVAFATLVPSASSTLVHTAARDSSALRESARLVLYVETDGDDEQPLVTLKYVAFHHHFEPGFCITVHAGQGDTIRVPFTIFDFDSMTTELRYTAITRASSADLVQIDTKRANTFADGSTFEERADDERYVAWATRQCPSAESVLGRFLQFVDDRSTAGLEETLVDETNDDEAEEEEDLIVRLREALKRQRDEAGPSGVPARKKPMFSMADLKAARDATWNVPLE